MDAACLHELALMSKTGLILSTMPFNSNLEPQRGPAFSWAWEEEEEEASNNPESRPAHAQRHSELVSPLEIE